MGVNLDAIALGAQIELARRHLWDYCQLKYPRHYTDDRDYLREMCDRIEAFGRQNKKRFLIINVPPRHYKSFTGGNFVEWRFGEDPSRKVMTGSYNETLSTTFARKVRDTIDEQPSPGVLTYRDIFPNTRVKYGQASASKWALEGSTQDSYLATSPSGTATGFGANDIVIDDIIKNAEEAYSEAVLEKHWSWLVNTMLSRTEGDDWKVYVFMTRWAQGDLAGRIIEAFPDDVEIITFKAVQDDGSMLCESVLSRRDYDLKTKEMNHDIVEANYNQKPIDISGRLFSDFTIYDELPTTEAKKFNYTDTADKGTDYLCSVDYIVHEGDVYVTDVVMTDEGMETTEPSVAEMLFMDDVNEAVIESNNGGRGFARNIERILREKYDSSKCVVTWQAQTANKEARILASSAWVNAHIIMPFNWKNKWPEFYKQLLSYQKKGKNLHDDAPDVLAAIYDAVANPSKKKSRLTVI
jgi:predicted phage terminase large subunit-like protein